MYALKYWLQVSYEPIAISILKNQLFPRILYCKIFNLREIKMTNVEYELFIKKTWSLYNTKFMNIILSLYRFLKSCKSNDVWLIDIPCFNLTWHYANWHKNEEDVIDFLYKHTEEKSYVCSTITTLTWMMRIRMVLNKAINQNMISAWSIHKTLMYPWYSTHYTKVNKN